MTMTRSSRFQLLSSQFVFRFGSVFAALAFAAAWSLALSAQQPVDGPQYVDGNTLVRPANYREWMFLGSGLA